MRRSVGCEDVKSVHVTLAPTLRCNEKLLPPYLLTLDFTTLIMDLISTSIGMSISTYTLLTNRISVFATEIRGEFLLIHYLNNTFIILVL